MAARHRSRGHRDADGRGAPAQRGRQAPSRHRARSVRAARVGMEGAVGRHDFASGTTTRQLGRLVARSLHDGRRPLARRHRSVCEPLPGRAHLPRQAPRQLGSGASHRALRFGSAHRRRRARLAVALSLSLGRRIRSSRRRNDAPRDDAGRHGRRRASGRRTIQGAQSANRFVCRSRIGLFRSSRTNTSIPRSVPDA